LVLVIERRITSLHFWISYFLEMDPCVGLFGKSEMLVGCCYWKRIEADR
jgi:hypothetical protein